MVISGAPWTVATYMVEGRGSKDYALTKSKAYGDEAFFQSLIDTLVSATSAYLIEQVNRGAEVIQIFDSWAGVLSEEAFERWVIDPNKRLVDAIKAAHPNVPVIGFPRGAGIDPALQGGDFVAVEGAAKGHARLGGTGHVVVEQARGRIAGL